jgi:hypothetical protein
MDRESEDEEKVEFAEGGSTAAQSVGSIGRHDWLIEEARKTMAGSKIDIQISVPISKPDCHRLMSQKLICPSRNRETRKPPLGFVRGWSDSMSGWIDGHDSWVVEFSAPEQSKNMHRIRTPIPFETQSHPTIHINYLIGRSPASAKSGEDALSISQYP